MELLKGFLRNAVSSLTGMVPDLLAGKGTRCATGFGGEKLPYFSRASGGKQVERHKTPRSLDIQPSTLNPQPSTLNPRLLFPNCQPLDSHFQTVSPSTLISKLSAPRLLFPNCQPLDPNDASRVLGEELQARVKISSSSTYHYLSSHSPSAPSHSPSLRSVRSPLITSYSGGAPSDFPLSAGADACMLQTTIKALEAIAGEEVVSSVVCAVAAVLHLGDVAIGDASVAGGGRDQASFCVASQSLDTACSLLGSESEPHTLQFCGFRVKGFRV